MRINSYASTAQAIKAPFTFYYVQDNDWSESHNWDYWNKNFTSAASVDNTATAKTIYDPSVSGFALPRTAAFTNFTLSGDNTVNIDEFNVSGSFIKGWNFCVNGWRTGSTIFFHALGIRNTTSSSSGIGNVAFVSNMTGREWTSGAYSDSYGRNFGFASNDMGPQHLSPRSRGYVLRPALE